MKKVLLSSVWIAAFFAADFIFVTSVTFGQTNNPMNATVVYPEGSDYINAVGSGIAASSSGATADMCKKTETYETTEPIYENKTVGGKIVPVLAGYEKVTRTRAVAEPDGTPCAGGTCVSGICKLTAAPYLGNALVPPPTSSGTQKVELYFNPKEYQLDKSVQWEPKRSRTDAPTPGSKTLQPTGNRNFEKTLRPVDLNASSVLEEISGAPDTASAPHKVTVRGWDPQKKALITAKIQTKIAADPNIRAADISKDEVRIDYAEPAKLFWIFPTSLNVSYRMDRYGHVKVRFPWLKIFMKSNAQNVANDVQAVFQNNQTNLEFLKLQDEVQRQSESFNALSNIAKQKHDAAQAAIQNTR